MMAKNATKELIITKSNELFKEHGYENVSILNICESCNISKTTFYYHIKSKEDILLSFYDQVTHDLSSMLLSMLSQKNYWDQFITGFNSLIDASMKFGPDFFSQMLIANLKTDHGSYDLRDELTHIMVMIVKNAQEAGQITNPGKPEDIYTSCAYAYLGHETTWCIKKGKYDWKNEMLKSLETICCIPQKTSN
jgi:AcrR family transcriptional regulator